MKLHRPDIRILRPLGESPEGTCPHCWGDPKNYKTGSWYLYLDGVTKEPFNLVPGRNLQWTIPANVSAQFTMHRSDGARISTNKYAHPREYSIRMEGKPCQACDGKGTLIAFARRRFTKSMVK